MKTNKKKRKNNVQNNITLSARHDIYINEINDKQKYIPTLLKK